MCIFIDTHIQHFYHLELCLPTRSHTHTFVDAPEHHPSTKHGRFNIDGCVAGDAFACMRIINIYAYHESIS